jgi:calcineurin-like phosphoesterase family protein
MERKLTFFTSDWHLGHTNVLKYDLRPFRDIKHMAESLILNFNSTVPDGSVTYFLGDMGMHSADDISKALPRMNGTKVLVLGNHDKGSEAMYKAGFDVVVNGVTLWVANQRVTLSHCPLLGVFREHVDGMKGAVDGDHWHGERKNTRFTVEDLGQFHLHGHIHSRPGVKERIDGRQMDVGVAANNYRPVCISAVESWIAKTVADTR